MAKILFSIVVPVFNAEEYLSYCIESILNQTFKEFELILVDDGSTDSSLEICKSYQNDEPRIKILSQMNKGPFAARKYAYSLIKGSYVLHVDADDALRLDALESIHQVIQGGHYDLILFDYSCKPDFSSNDSAIPFSSSRAFSEHQKADLINLLFYRSALNTIWSKAVSKDLILQIDYPNDMLGMVTGEDLLQSAFLLDKSKSQFYLKIPIYYYRINKLGTTYTFRVSDIDDRLCSRRHLLTLVRKWNQIEGVTITDDDVLYSMLESFYRYIQSGVLTNHKKQLSKKLNSVINEELLVNAWRNDCVRNKLRLDMRVILKLTLEKIYGLSAAIIQIEHFIRRLLKNE